MRGSWDGKEGTMRGAHMAERGQCKGLIGWEGGGHVSGS